MANPFLMDDDIGGMDDPSANPFLIQSGSADTADDNPFAADSAVNPFAFGDDGEAEAQEADIDPAMSFFGTTIEAEDDVLSIKSTADEEEESKKGPPPRPLPPQTQELITTVSNQMDETSSELLGRIPATRSPSPVSMRDLHSPSPTPDSGLADLLDCSDSGSSANIQGFDVDLIGSGSNAVLNDNPFGIPTGIGNLQGAAPIVPPAKQQPPRPPPPRPAPPRPAPPSAPGHQPQPPPPPRPAPPAVLAQNDNPPPPPPASDSDDLFMFGTAPPPKPPPPKTKEDILSLFDKPTQPVAKPDLLSDDLELDPTAAEPEPETGEDPADDPIFNSVLTRPDDSTHNITSEPQSAQARHANRIAPQELTNKQRAPTPDIEITTVEDLPRSDDEEEPEPPVPQKEPEQEPEEPEEAEEEPQPKVEPLRDVPVMVIETEPTPPADEDDEEEKSIVPKAVESDQSPPTESADTNAAPETSVNGATSDLGMIEPDLESQHIVEEMDTGLDFAPPSGTGSANPFASPDEEEETFPPAEMVTNIFAADDATAEDVTENIFTTMADTGTAENIFTSMADSTAMTEVENIFTSMTDSAVTENIFTSMADTTVVENIFTSMSDAVPVTAVENIFTSMADTVTTSAAENIFTSMADTAPIPAAAINIFSADPEPEVDTSQSYGTNIFAEPDEFDAFAAKFESVKKDNISILDGFGGSGGSGAVTPTVGDGTYLIDL